MSFVGSGKLLVKPLTAKLTHDTETFGKMDPYCKVWLEKEIKQTKTHKEGGKYPSWNDTFTFQRNLECLLYIEVWDEDTLSADDLIGETTISLSETFEKKKTQIWYTISYKGKDAGKVLVSLEFIPDPIEKRPQAPASYPSVPTIPMMPGLASAMHLGYNLPQMYMQGSQAPPTYPIPSYPPNPYYAPSPPSYPPPSSQNNFQGLQRTPTVAPGPYSYPPYGGYPPQGQGYGQGGQGYPPQGPYGGPPPPQNYNQGDYSGGGKFPPGNQGGYPPSNQYNQGGPYPQNNQGGAFSQNNQSSPYPNNAQGSYPNNNQGGPYPQNNQGAYPPPNNQAGPYPPNNQVGAYPPSNQGAPYSQNNQAGASNQGPYPPNNSQGGPYPPNIVGGANQGGPYPQTFQGAPCPPNTQTGPSNNQGTPYSPNNLGNNQSNQEGALPAQNNIFNQFGQGQEGRQQNVPKTEARIEEGYPSESVVLQNNGQGFGGN